MKLVIAGSRSFGKEPNKNDSEEVHEKYARDTAIMFSFLSKIPFIDKITHVISGKAKGADTLGEVWAKNKGCEILDFPANWKPQGFNGLTDKSAGIKRNRKMAEAGDVLVVFWDGVSPGTKNMIDEMSNQGKPYYVCRTDLPMPYLDE